MRIACLVVAALLTEVGSAAACPVSTPERPRPCLKYKSRERTIYDHAVAYRRTSRGNVPRWSEARIGAFLAGADWEPITARDEQAAALAACKRKRRACAVPLEKHPDGATITYARPARIAFVPASRARQATTGERVVLIRRIERQRGAILVEVDHEVFRLTRCAAQRGFSCLVRTDRTLTPVDPEPKPDASFAQPPP